MTLESLDLSVFASPADVSCLDDAFATRLSTIGITNGGSDIIYDVA